MVYLTTKQMKFPVEGSFRCRPRDLEELEFLG
jgi:hypothetical protein